MRWTLALVPLLMLSGCLAADPDDGNKESGPGLEKVDPTPRKGVVFYNEPYTALPNDPLEFTITVPEGARNVRLEMSVSGAATPADEASVTLSGCGQATVSWDPGPNVVVAVGGSSWREAELCAAPQGGSRLVNVDTGVTPMTGRLLLRADLPGS